MASPTPTFAHRLQFGLYQVLERVLGALPRPTVLAFGRAAGLLFCGLDARHRRVVRDNLRAAHLGLDEAAVRRLSRDCFQHFGALAFITLHQMRASAEELRELTRIQGAEHLEAAIAEGKAVILTTGHLGNWELLGLTLSLSGWDMSVVGRALDNPLLEARLGAFRARFGNAVIPKAGAVRGALRAVKERRLVSFLVDQDAMTRGVFVKFMGRWASTYSTPGMLAARFQLPIVPIASRMLEDGRLEVTISPAFHAPATGDPERDAWVATQRITAWVEARVREAPEQWFWMHRRFKTQPGPGTPEPPPEAWLTAFAKDQA